jgi:hypothetical protein
LLALTGFNSIGLLMIEGPNKHGTVSSAETTNCDKGELWIGAALRQHKHATIFLHNFIANLRYPAKK